MPRVAVVGAGLAGLTAAIYLERRSVEVTVFEASDRVGGRVTTDSIDGFRCDRGFQVINPSYSEIRRLQALKDIEFSPINTNVIIDGVKYGTAHWINNLSDVIDNYNNMPNNAIDDIKPNEAFLEKNHRKIYYINYCKNSIKTTI